MSHPAGRSGAPVSRGLLVYSGIRQAILRHDLPPGTKLAEDEIARIYGVSRTIVRSSLQALSKDRLVTLERHKGASVAQPSPIEAREIFEARALLETQVARMAAERSTPPDIGRLRVHIRDENAAIKAQNTGEALSLSARFHVEIAEIAAHSIYLDFVKDLCSRSSLIIALYWKRRDTVCECHAHDALVDAIEHHRVDDAGELMKSHMVDLLSGLDLSPPKKDAVDLRAVLPVPD